MTTFNSRKIFILGAFFAVSHIVYAQDTAAHDLVLEQRLKTCAFEVIGTSHIKIGDRNLLEEQTFCSFPLMFEKVQQHFGQFPPAHGWLTITKIFPIMTKDLMGQDLKEIRKINGYFVAMAI